MQEAGLGGCGGRSGPQSVNLCKGMCIDWGKKKSFSSVPGDGCSRAGLSLDSSQQEDVWDLKMVKIHKHQELMSCLSTTCFGSKLTSRT